MVYKRLFIFLISCLINIVSVLAQVTCKVDGSVRDVNGAYLPYVNMVVRTNKCQKICTITDETGRFSVNVEKCDTCTIVCSYVGYTTTTSVLTSLLCDKTMEIIMEEDVNALKEVVVDGVRVVFGTDKTMYFPSEIQKRSADSGVRLLYNMMIPDINVERNSGDATTRDKKKITYCINGIVATVKELKSIRPKDLIRVDFYPAPSGKFSCYDAVVDFLVKYVDKGGYFSVRTESDFLAHQGEYSPSHRWHNGSWDFHTVFEMDFLNDKKTCTNTDEFVNLSPSFNRLSNVESCQKKSLDGYFFNKSIYSADNVKISLSPGFIYSKTPKEEANSLVTYNTAMFTSNKSQVGSRNFTFGPLFTCDMSWEINDAKEFCAHLEQKYNRNTYTRMFCENEMSEPLSIDTKENVWECRGHVAYTINSASKRDYFTIKAGGAYTSYDDVYSSTLTEKHLLKKIFVDCGVVYDKYFSKSFKLHAGMVVRRHITIQNEMKQNEIFLLPEITSSFRLSNKSRLVVGYRTNYLSALTSWKNTTNVKVNQYEILRGNASLPYCLSYWPSVTYSHDYNNVSVNAFSYAILSSKSIRDRYVIEKNKLIHSFDVCDSYIQSLSGVSATLYGFDRHFQLSGSFAYNIMKINDEKNWYLKNLSFSINASYSVCNVFFSTYYYSKDNVYGGSGSAYYKIPSLYGFSVLWSHNNFSLGLDVDNFFNTKRYEGKYVNGSNYSCVSQEYMLKYFPSAKLHFSIDLDYGRKKIERASFDVNKNITNGILRPNK